MRKTWFPAVHKGVPVSAGFAMLLLVACGGDGTGPGPGTGPDLTPISSAISSAVGPAIDDNAVLTSFLGLRGAILNIVQPPPVVGSAGVPVQVNTVPLMALSGGLLASAVPDDLLGRTLIWDTDLDLYVPKPNDDFMAPANGARFRLYTLSDPNKPREPLQDIGFFDLVDVSAGTLDLTGTISDNTAARVGFQATGNVGVNFDFGATGFFSDGTQTIDFDVGSKLGSNGLTLTTTLNVSTNGVTYESIAMAGGGGNGSGTKEVTVTSATHTVKFFINFDSNGNIGSNSTVEVDNVPAATVSGSFNSPSAKRIPGSDLSGDSLGALRTMLEQGFVVEVTSSNLLVFAFFLNQGLFT